MRLEVLKLVTMKSINFWDITLYTLAGTRKWLQEENIRLLAFLFNPEGEGSTFLQIINQLLPNQTVIQP
jgi:hypothetical protein